MKSRMPERARTDPWEPQGSNPLGPPGPELRNYGSFARAGLFVALCERSRRCCGDPGRDGNGAQQPDGAGREQRDTRSVVARGSVIRWLAPTAAEELR